MPDSTRLTIELEVILRRLQQTLRGLDQVERRLQRIANIRVGQRQSTASFDRQAVAAQRLALQQQRLQLQQQRLSVQTQELANRQERARQTTERLTRSNDRLTQSVSRQSRVVPQLQQRLNSLGAAALRVGGGLRSVGASASILVTGPLVALGTLAAKSAADIDAIRNRLIATEGSLEAANQRLAQLRKLADDSVGVTRRTALDTFAILATLGEVTEDTINKQIRSFGRLNAAFTIDDQQVFFRNLLQIFQQGFEIKDIREALGRVPIFNSLLESAFGTSDPDKLRQLKAAGKLTLDTFLAGLATAVETDPVLGQVGESIRVRLAKTFERITDALEPLGLAILGPLERIVTRVEPIILRISQAFAQLPPSIQTAIVVVGILAAALGPVLFVLGGIASGVGAIATALAALLPILGSIGLPAIAVLLAGIIAVTTEIIVVITALALAWRTNFLGIQQLVTNAANAVTNAFRQIRQVFQEASQRILPTLQSIVTRVLSAITAAWNTYGATVVRVVGDTFRFVTDVTVVFLKLFTDFVDLVLKLIDGDWRGAWGAFARIVITQLDNIGPLVLRFARAFNQALLTLSAFLIRQAVRFAEAGSRLAAALITSLAIGIIAGAPRITNALSVMMLAAVAGVAFGPIAQAFLAGLFAELRKVAAEDAPKVGVDVGFEGGIAETGLLAQLRRLLRGLGTGDEDGGDAKTENILRRQLDRLQEARDKFAEVQEESQIALLRSRIETEFETTKAGLDRQLSALEQSFDDRLVALKQYLAERKSLEEAQIDAEIEKELELTSVLFQELSARTRAALREFETEVTDIKRDPRLQGEARQAALNAAQVKKATELQKAATEFRLKHGEATARVVQLEKQRVTIGEQLARVERLISEEIGRQQVGIRADLLEQQGRTADAESLRLRARFTDALRDLRVDVSELAIELQDALANVDLTVLQSRLDELPEPVRQLIELLDIGIKRAQIVEAQQLVDDLSAGLRLDEQRIQNRVLDGLLSQRDAQAAILVLQQHYRSVLLDVLQGELAKAEAIQDQGQIVALQTQIAEVERLGIAIDEVGQDINRALFQDLQSGLSGIFSGARKGFEGLRDAALSFGERLLDTLNDIAASSIVNQLEDLFKPDATNTRGTVGGFFSKIFGLAPKQAEATTIAATLQTGATTAAATTTASGTAFGATVISSAASFAATILAAAAGFAATVTAGGVAQTATGGLGSLLGGAATGMFPAVPGGVFKFVEGGHPEAVLTTDPKHAARQVAILRAFLRETRGLGGRIKAFAAGGFANSADMMLSGMSGMSLPSSDVGSLAIAGAPSMMRIRQVLVDERHLGDWVNSSEGEQVMVDWLYRHEPIIRKMRLT